jgi:hypothetical protein
MKTPENRTLTLLIIGVLSVAYLMYWLLRMSSLPLIAEAVLVGGIIAAVAWESLCSGGNGGPAARGLGRHRGDSLRPDFLGLNIWAGWYTHFPALSATKSR